jgi:magnesium chelatase subunit I
MTKMNIPNIKTLGELKASGYKSKSIKEELRQNLIRKLKDNEVTFPGIIGYEDSVIPDVERAMLSNITSCSWVYGDRQRQGWRDR